MDRRFTPTPRDAKRAATIKLFDTDATFPDIANGSEIELLDLTPYVTKCSQTPNELSLSLAWHLELYGAMQPQPGQLIAAYMDGLVLAICPIESVNDYREEVGNRSLSVTCRSRDATPLWRQLPRVTLPYPMGTRLDLIARDVALSMGLDEVEILLPDIGQNTARSNTQLANVPGWSMLEALLLPSGFEPVTDSLGRLKAVSRDVLREADVTLTDDRIISVNGSRSKPAITRLKVQWLNPTMGRVEQQDRPLARETITAGFFQLRQRKKIYFSDDRTQRAMNTYMHIESSVNSGILPVGDEDYEQLNDLEGRITVTTLAWVPALLLAFLAVKLAGAFPDIAPTFGGPTIPTGKKVHARLEFAVMLTLASMGTGMYEIYGTPFEYVDFRNTMEAYNPDAPIWADNMEEVSTDFVVNEDQAKAMAAREFIYRAKSATSYGATIVDDARIEVGDILALPDGSKVYVTSWSRDLTFGASAVLDVQGFRV